MPNKLLLALLFSFGALAGCTDKPEVEPTKHSNLSVYPNPASNRARVLVDLPQGISYNVEVYDPKGKIILSEDESVFDHDIDLSEKLVGKYQVILKSGDKVTYYTLLKVE